MEAIENANRWHQWSVKGTSAILTQVLDNLATKHPRGWRRLSGEDLQPFQPLVRPSSTWYSLEAASTGVGVTLSVERVRDLELRGGRVRFAGSPQDTPFPAFPLPGSK